MQHARRVQGTDAVDELDQRAAQAIGVGGGGRGRAPGAVGAAGRGGRRRGVGRGREVAPGEAARWRRAADVVQEADALDALHGEEPLLAVREQLVQRDEVGVRDVGQGAELVLEAIERAVGVGPQHLQRDPRVALAVERFVDDAEGARTQPPLDHEPVRPREGLGVGRAHSGTSGRGPRGCRAPARRGVV